MERNEALQEFLVGRVRTRERLLSGVLWSAVVGFSFITVWMLIRDHPTPTTVVVMVAASLAVLTVSLLHSLAFWVRLGVFAFCVHVGAAHSIATHGYTPNSFLALGTIVMLVTVALGRRAGLIAIGMTAFTLVTVSAFQSRGVLVRVADWQRYCDSADPSVVTRVCAIFVLVMITFVVCISYLVEHSENLALQTLRSFATLQLEQIEKARIMADLVEREAALEALNHTLEQRVDERTARLRDANQALSQEMKARLQMEIELRQAHKLESIGRLAAGVAHEINTPLQFVSDNVDFLRGADKSLTRLLTHYRAALTGVAEGQPAQQALAAARALERELDVEYLMEDLPCAIEQSMEGLDRVATIVRSLREFSHPDRTEMMPVDLNRALEHTLRIAATEYKHVAELETEFAELPHVTCYASQVNQAVLNVITNAAHAIADVSPGARDKGRITVRTRRDADDVIISINDNGTGIPEAIRERIYDPFFTTKEVGKGTGQGLSITRSVICDKHGGKLSFETELGSGTTFFLRIPIAGTVVRGQAAPFQPTNLE